MKKMDAEFIGQIEVTSHYYIGIKKKMDLQMKKSTSDPCQEDREEKKKARGKEQFPPDKEKLLDYYTRILSHSDSESCECLEDAMMLITVISYQAP